jgi:hypothetical protein
MTDNDATLLDSLRLIYASADTWGMYYSLDDMVRGVCQARRHGRAPQALVELVLVSREPCP